MYFIVDVLEKKKYLVLYKKNIDPIVFSCCCSTAREMTGQCENNTSNQMLPETNIDKSPYTYI